MDGEDWIAGEAGSDSSGDEAEGTVLSHPLTSHDTSSSDSCTSPRFHEVDEAADLEVLPAPSCTLCWQGMSVLCPWAYHKPPSTSTASGSEDGYAKVEQPRGGDVSVVYLRDDVAVWPSRTTRIDGRLSLLEQNG